MSNFAESSASEQELHATKRGSPRLWLWLTLLAALAGVMAWRMFNGHNAVEEEGNGRKHAAVGMKFAAVSLEPLTGGGQPIGEADLAGKVTLINFWGPWCGYCRDEFPSLVESDEHFRSQKDFLFLSVSSPGTPAGEATLREETEQFLRQQRATFRTLRDPDDRTKLALITAAQLEHFGFPTTVVLGRDGTIRGLWSGYRPGDERYVREAIESALRGEALPPTDANPKR